MSEFEDALRKGLQAHRDATHARSEIDATLRALSSTVSELTDQKVEVKAGRVERTSIPLSTFLPRTVEIVQNQLREPEVPDALFAVRRGAEYGKRAQLCKLTLSPHGYPVELTFPGKFLHADDVRQLRAALAQLLNHPDVAGKIARVAELRGADPDTAVPSLDGSSIVTPEVKESVATLIREAADELGPPASQQTAQQARPWLDAGTAAERERGYRMIGDALQREEDLDAGIRSLLRDTVIDRTRSYTDRTECLRLLTYAHLVDDIIGSLAEIWFSEPELPGFFSAAMSGAFDKRAHLPPLLRQLEKIDIPRNDEGLQTTNIATHGHRVGDAFSSIRNALEHDRKSRLSTELVSQVRDLRGRYKDVVSLGPMLRDIERLIS